MKKLPILAVLGLIGLGAVGLGGVQFIMHKTSSPEFCVSCHSMEHPEAEWKGSTHFMNRKGIRAECADCHVPEDGLHYVKAKFIALKDVWYTLTNKLPDKQAYEAHRAEMAQRVWDDMKANNSATCRSCHSFGAMEIAEQSKAAQKMHLEAKTKGETCIDCHKGIVHFLPEVQESSQQAGSELAKHGGQMSANDPVVYALEMSIAQVTKGGELRLMPFAEVSNWQEKESVIQGQLQGWQQVGAESIVYFGLGKRIMLALVDDDAKANAQVLQTVHDTITDSEWKEVKFDISAPKAKLTTDLNALNQYGNNLNQSHCSGCHAPIEANHYSANQWIGVINSMKDRTSMTPDQVRAVTIYLQRNAKDMTPATH